MQSDVSLSNWSLGEVSPLIQQIAKNGAAMCIAALCTAFVFDYTFWLIVDPRMLSYFVLADHIQTAVHIFGLVSVILGTSSDSHVGFRLRGLRRHPIGSVLESCRGVVSIRLVPDRIGYRHDRIQSRELV